MVTKGKRPDRSFDYAAQWDEPSEEEELELEAYGPRGAALKRTLATAASKPTKPDSSVAAKLGARVSSFLKRTSGK